MKIIFLKDIKGVGKRFEEKSVSDGYALNFLIPKNLAIMADVAGIIKVEQLKKQEEKRRTLEEQKANEKELKRLEKHLELEKFRQEQHS